jgi:hypothetical protein
MVKHAHDIGMRGFTIIEPIEFSLMPMFLKQPSSSSVAVIQKNFIAIAGYMFEQSLKQRNHDIMKKFMNRIDDTDAPMIDLAQFQKLTDSELEAANLADPPVPYDHLWQLIDHVFKTMTTNIGMEVFKSLTLKKLENVKLLVYDHTTPAQRPHLDSTAPTLDTFIYFDTDAADVDCTVFRQTVNENGEFGNVEELRLDDKRWDHRYALPWTDTKHPIVSPAKVPNGTIIISSSNVIHNGPKSTTKGKRYVLYFSSTLPVINLDADDISSNTNEVTYAYERFKGEEEQHHLIAAACERFGSDWRQKVVASAVKEIDEIISNNQD